MSSIRARLLRGMLAGMTLLLLFSGIVVYTLVRRSLRGAFDQALVSRAEAILQVTEITEDGEFEFDREDLTALRAANGTDVLDYELRDAAGRLIYDENPEIDLSREPAGSSDSVSFHDMIVGNGLKARVVQIRYLPRMEDDAEVHDGTRDFTHTLTLSQSRTPLDASLNLIFWGVVVTGLLMLLLTIPIVWYAVQRGLDPLDQLSFRLGKIRPDNLAARLPETGQPAELIPLTEAFNQLLERIEVAYEREKRFTADAAHELRTPVAELKTLAEVMLRDEAVSADTAARGYIEDVADVVNRLEVLLTALLTMARLKQGRVEAQLSSVHLADATRSLIASFDDVIRERSLRIEFNARCPGEVNTHPELVLRLLENLLSNAVHHSPEGGQLSLRIRADAEQTSWTLSNPAPDLEMEDLARMNEPFWRKDPSRTGDQHLGMGLTLVQEYADQLGVELELRLEEDKRFSAEVRFPS